MPKTTLLSNEVDFNESYFLAAFKDSKEMTEACRTYQNQKKLVSFGDKYHIIQSCKKFRPQGNHQDDSVNMIKLIDRCAEKMGCRYDNIRYLALIRKASY